MWKEKTRELMQSPSAYVLNDPSINIITFILPISSPIKLKQKLRIVTNDKSNYARN